VVVFLSGEYSATGGLALGRGYVKIGVPNPLAGHLIEPGREDVGLSIGLAGLLPLNAEVAPAQIIRPYPDNIWT